MKNMLDNLDNGNLTDARKLAERHSWRSIFVAVRNSKGVKVAEATADYLKGRIDFRSYCEATHASKGGAQ